MGITRRTLFVLGAAAAAAGCSGSEEPTRSSSSRTGVATGSRTPDPTSDAVPDLRVETVAKGLEHVWGVGFLGEVVLFTERGGKLKVLRAGKVHEVRTDLDDVAANGEGGLMGLAVFPDAERTRRIVLAFNTTDGDVKVVPFTLSKDLRSATRGRPILTGIPANPSGRHSGCRLRFAPDGKLLVSTGDTAEPEHPQDLDSLAGKVLRVEPDGGAPTDNPFASGKGARRFVWTYGHRNVQGLAVHPESKKVFAVEQGTSVDDEVNLLTEGGNYGWNPVGSGYDESKPMTDTSIEGAIPALWSSGDSTLATCGGTFVSGREWAGYSGHLMVACLKAQTLLAMPVDGESIGEVRPVEELHEKFGRLRTAEFGPDGSLWIGTSDGDDDKLLRVRPA